MGLEVPGFLVVQARNDLDCHGLPFRQVPLLTQGPPAVLGDPDVLAYHCLQGFQGSLECLGAPQRLGAPGYRRVCSNGRNSTADYSS